MDKNTLRAFALITTERTQFKAHVTGGGWFFSLFIFFFFKPMQQDETLADVAPLRAAWRWLYELCMRALTRMCARARFHKVHVCRLFVRVSAFPETT